MKILIIIYSYYVHFVWVDQRKPQGYNSDVSTPGRGIQMNTSWEQVCT